MQQKPHLTDYFVLDCNLLSAWALSGILPLGGREGHLLSSLSACGKAILILVSHELTLVESAF